MTDRSSLGSADVSDDTLAAMVADLLGHDAVELVRAVVEPVDYDVPSITTIGRHWVSGAARTPDGVRPYRLFVKQSQAWQHSPFFQFVPEEVRELAAASYPWSIEAAVYRSDLRERLPSGLTMPRALGVFETEPDSVVVWIEAVPHEVPVWDADRHERAAYLLGRLAARPAVMELGNVGDFEWDVMDYVNGRLRFDVVPRIASGTCWQPPAAEMYGEDLRARLGSACDRLEAAGRELMIMPHLASHGDASPNNLLPGLGDDIVLIDFGLWLPKPVGFDLGQLLAGEVQLGRLPDIPLEELDEQCVAAYTRGLADEGTQIDVDVVRRAHALQLFLFNGISALPEAGAAEQVCAARALLARHSLDLLDRTA